MAFNEDLDEFFDTDDFGVTATYTPTVGSPVSVIGIFRDEYVQMDVGSVGIEAVMPTFTCPLARLPNAKQGETITYNAVVYTIRNVQRDGTPQGASETGIVKLFLEAP